MSELTRFSLIFSTYESTVQICLFLVFRKLCLWRLNKSFKRTLKSGECSKETVYVTVYSLSTVKSGKTKYWKHLIAVPTNGTIMFCWGANRYSFFFFCFPLFTFVPSLLARPCWSSWNRSWQLSSEMWKGRQERYLFQIGGLSCPHEPFQTGLRGMSGNKGAVGIRLDYHDTGFCFLTGHLAAGHSNVEERNADYRTIVNGLHFQKGKTIQSHE